MGEILDELYREKKLIIVNTYFKVKSIIWFSVITEDNPYTEYIEAI